MRFTLALLRLKTVCLTLAGIGLASSGHALAAELPVRSIITNGDFETDADNDAWPDQWPHPDFATWGSEDGNRFLRISSTESAKLLLCYRGIEFKSGPTAFDVSMKVRTVGVVKGEESWHDARVVFGFVKTWGGDKIKPEPKPLVIKPDTDGWIEVKTRVNVPVEAKIMEFMPALFFVKAGRLDIDDVVITPAREEAEPAASSIEPKDVRPLREPVPIIEDIYQAPQPSPLRVEGNRVLNAAGAPVVLRGLNAPSLEWNPQGEGVLNTIRVAIDQWNARIIRLPVEMDFWLGDGGKPSEATEAYRKLVDACIFEAGQRGVYVILDLHEYLAPPQEAIAFWASAAPRYANHPAVLFGLYNEPHDTTWDVWRNGGPAEKKEKDGTITTFQSVGQQALIDTIREAGANNLIVAGGLGWAYDLSGIVNGYALEDTATGSGIMYDTHIYNWHVGWQDKVLATAAKHPVIVGECGSDTRKMPFVPADLQENPYTWSPDFLGMTEQYGLHWTAWCFHPNATPRVISDWTYEPTPFWGAFVRSALAGGRFEMNRLR